MGKHTIYMGENKGADQLRGNRKLISAFVFAARIVQLLYFLNPKSSSVLVQPSLCQTWSDPNCLFSHGQAYHKLPK